MRTVSSFKNYLENNFIMFIVGEEARAGIIHNLLKKDGLFKLSKEDTDTICNLTEGIHVVSIEL